MNFTAYYIIGLPLSMLFTFHFRFGIFGLWMGLLTGQFCTTSFALSIILTTDWENEVARAQKLIGAQGEIYERSMYGAVGTTDVSDSE
jgi:multidrug resistance protein, MATE family